MIVISVSAGNVFAQGADSVRQMRHWAADVIRGNSENSSKQPELPASDEFLGRVSAKSRELIGDVDQLLERQIGWLRPSTIKEAALLWIAVAAVLPWLILSLLRPILQWDLAIVRMLIVGLLLMAAFWSGWTIWGEASGQERFIATMLIFAPFLATYFHSITDSITLHTS